MTRVICFLLALCLAIAAFAGCSDSKETASSSSGTSSKPAATLKPDNSGDNNEQQVDTESQPSEEVEVPDEPMEEIGDEPEDEIYYDELIVDNTKVSSVPFRGVNFIHQMFSYQLDDFAGRTYTDAQRAYELETMEKMGVKMIRSFYGSAYTYDAKTGTQVYDSERMKNFFKGCKAMDSIGAEVGVTPTWQFSSLVKNEVNTKEVNASLGCPGIVVKDDWNATLKNYRDFMKNTVLSLKAHGVNNVKYFFAYTECNNTFNDKLNINGEKSENSRDDREYEKIYPLYNDLITALDGALKDAGLRNQYKIVGPCDNWRADDGSEPESLLVRYTIDHLSDKVDIIGSHNGYDRANEYVDDMYYEIPFEKLEYPMVEARKVNKEYWVDEYNVAVNKYGYETVYEANKNPWKGVAVGAMTNAIMNMGDISNVFLWTLWNEQWPDNTGNDVDGEFNNGIQICGYLECLFETQIPTPAWYSVSLISRYVGTGHVYKGSTPGYETYISGIKRDDGEETFVVTNYAYENRHAKISFEKSLGGKTLYRYVYHAGQFEPVSGNEMIAADAVAKNVTTGFYDELPAGSVTIYTTEKPKNIK